MNPFWNRSDEIREIQSRVGKPGFGYVTGRRRIGKTALLSEVCEKFHGIYHQAVEGTAEQQLLHLTEEIREHLSIFRDITPTSWIDFFKLLSREKLPPLLVFDEFPYWVQGDPNLPSIFQKWIDHELGKHNTLVLVSGSSQAMLYGQFLRHSSPLYGRISFHLHLPPISFDWFCKACDYKPGVDSFERFSVVGGIPHYWKLMPKAPLLDQVEMLYFQPTALLSEEPLAMLRDEGVTGSLAKAMIDLIGRGVSKPSELAARLGQIHGNLSRPLALLLELGLINRELPFGESSRSTKRVVYSVQDAVLSFYFGTYLPHRMKWPQLNSSQKKELIHLHASRQWEYYCRSLFPGSSRYWEGNVEIDLIAPQKNKKTILVAECKWKKIIPSQEEQLLEELKRKFAATALTNKHPSVEYRIFSQNHLASLV